MNYVVCLVFDGPKEFVVLIEKQRPAWQRGLFNGPGGKVEEGENILAAAQREFLEETGVNIPVKQWRSFAELRTEDGNCVYFMAAHKPCNVRTMTDEKIGWYNIIGIRDGCIPVIPNLRWLIPMALDESHEYAELACSFNSDSEPKS